MLGHSAESRNQVAAPADWVDLDRDLAPLKKDQAASLDLGILGRRYGGWMSWAEVLMHQRVVVLAEAASGKTAELRGLAAKMRGTGASAFFLRIEDLADSSLEDALDPDDCEAFRAWREAPGLAWFFLDSVDEARLNRKSFEGALRRFSRALGDTAPLVHVVVSCRASDWLGRSDRQSIERILPLPPPAPAAIEVDPDQALLGPIFDPKPNYRDSVAKAIKPPPEAPDLLVVQLTPLTNVQRAALARHADTPDVAGFLDALPRAGLDTFAERPGDLLELAAYWREKRAFGWPAEMTEHAISVKLRETHALRTDSGELAPQEARDGAERLAAALTFGRSFTLLAAGAEADPTLAAGALDAGAVLSDWTEAKLSALLRRAIFAPSTYGRLRFHHRTSQEYLAASWLHRLLDAGAPLSAVWEVIFAERYGIETVVPSLRPVAAWLALKQPAIRDEIIRREPVVLLMHGDPRSLPIDSRRALLRAYAARDAAGELSHAMVDHRAIWLFSDPALADTLREVWAVNPDPGFRNDLVRCIQEANIATCADLAVEVALDPSGRDYHRGTAVDALVACGATKEIARLVALIRDPETPTTTHLARAFADSLYPTHLAADDVVALFARAIAPPGRTIDSSGRHVEELLRRGSREQRRALAVGLARAALRGPFQRRRERLIPRHAEIVRGLAGFITEELDRLSSDASPSEDLMLLLRALSRAGYDRRARDDAPDVRGALQRKPRANLALFWQCVDEARVDFAALSRPWQVILGDSAPLWSLGPDDLDGLTADVRAKAAPLDREIALAGVMQVLRDTGEFETRAVWLDDLVAGDSGLQQTVGGFRTPAKVDPAQARWEALSRRNEAKQAAETEAAKESWRAFRRALEADPTLLSGLQETSSWSTGGFRLWDLTKWLARQEEHNYEVAVLRWRELAPVFGPAVAEAFRQGLASFWRVTAPRRPTYSSENTLTTYNSTPLAFGGVSVEAADDPAWIAKLSDDEVRRAAGHGAISQLSYPDWLAELLVARKPVALPVVLDAVHREWSWRWGTPTLLRHYARNAEDVPAEVADKIVRLFRAGRPGNLGAYQLGVELLAQRDLPSRQVHQLAALACDRWRADTAAGEFKRGRVQLSLALSLLPAKGLDELARWIDGEPATKEIEATLGELFGRDSAALPQNAWGRFTVSDLERLVRLVYRHVPRAEDPPFGEPRVMAPRDYAQQARDAALSALLARPGHETFAVLRRLAERGGDFELSAHRLRELAHRHAEQDSEFEAWMPSDVVRFMTQHASPATTGAELLRVVEGVLRDIQLSFRRADAHSGDALTLLTDEAGVQLWLAEQLNFRAAGRYHAARETEVADENRPDVVVSSTHGPCQVAIEVKHGGKDWPARRLQAALTQQLAGQYLLPENRRHGVLVVTHHATRSWRHPQDGTPLGFKGLMDWLDERAREVTHNVAGSVEVRAMGLDPHAQA